MKKKYILQINRKYLWEDVVTYTQKQWALRSLFKLRIDNPKLQVRVVEVLVIC